MAQVSDEAHVLLAGASQIEDGKAGLVIDVSEKLFQRAETILVRDELPIVPLYIYVGINYFDTNKISGIWENVLDQHPLNSIHKKKAGP